MCLRSKKLKKYETYNERTEKWLNLFLKRELDDTDPVFQEVLKFYNNCIEKGLVSDMLVQESTYAKMVASEMQDAEGRGEYRGSFPLRQLYHKCIDTLCHHLPFGHTGLVLQV